MAIGAPFESANLEAVAALGRVACETIDGNAVESLGRAALHARNDTTKEEAVHWLIELLAEKNCAQFAERELANLWGKNSPMLHEVLESAKNMICNFKHSDLHSLLGVAVRNAGIGVVHRVADISIVVSKNRQPQANNANARRN